MSKEQLLDLLGPLTEFLRGIPLGDPGESVARIEERFPYQGETVETIRHAMVAAVDEGWLVPREKGAVKFGRLAAEYNGFSLDVVLSGGDGPRHLHPKGEVNLMFSWDGEPIFDGCEPGWAVFPPGSTHVPAVVGGQMLILYLLPDGEVEWV
jgi:hypothetical protein